MAYKVLLLLLVSLALDRGCAAPTIQDASLRRDGSLSPRQTAAGMIGVFSMSQFVNRAYQASTVLGDFLYIDGGEIAFLDDNNVFIHLPDNNTYSIDISKSWTNETIIFNVIQKSAPVMNYVALWPDVHSDSIYAFGGEQSRALHGSESPVVAPTSLWQFVPKGKNGQWTEVTTSQDFTGINRPAGAIGTSGLGEGYLLGGYLSSHTSLETSQLIGYLPAPGLLQFDFLTQTWSNLSALGYSPDGTAQYGQGQVISGFSDHEVVAFFGGETSNLVQWSDTASGLVPFSTISIYDPTTDTWYKQTASGTIPESRDRFCSVGIQGDNNTFEIFMFGGHVATADGTEPQASDTQTQQVRNNALDEVFVLSLPSFNWQKADYAPNWPRVDHSCNVIGNRQMVAIGGINPASNNFTTLLQSQDPWANAIGIFDLTEMQWSDGYDAKAAKYESPQAVKSWYLTNGMYPSHWDEPAMANYFQQPVPPQQPPAPISSTSMTHSKDSSLNAGAIAGGVLGGLGVATTISFIIYWYLRRRSLKKADDDQSGILEEIDKETGTVQQSPTIPLSSASSSMVISPMSDLGSAVNIGLALSTKNIENQRRKTLPVIPPPLALPVELATRSNLHEMAA